MTLKEFENLGHNLTPIIVYPNGTNYLCRNCGARLWKELLTPWKSYYNVTTVGNDIFDGFMTCTEVMIKDIIE